MWANQSYSGGDYDNDGNFDLLVANVGEPNFLYQNNGNSLGATRITTGPMVTDSDDSFGANWIDIDNDGQLELFVANGGTVGGSVNRIYDNAGNDNNWLKIRLSGSITNNKGIGTRLEMIAGGADFLIGDIPKYEISSDPGSSLEAHFGIHDSPDVGLIIVKWSSGNASFIESPVLNQILTISEETATPNYQSAGWLDNPQATQEVLEPDIAYDSTGYIIAAGAFSGEVIFGNDTVSSADLTDKQLFVVKYDTTGNVIWAVESISSGGTNEQVMDIWLEVYGTEIYVCGIFEGTIDFGNATPITPTGLTAMFLARYDMNGTLIDVQTAETTDYLHINGMTVNNAGDVFITGYFSTDIDFGTNVLSGGFDNMFLAKYQNGTNIWAVSLGDTLSQWHLETSDLAASNNGRLYVAGQFSMYTPSTIDFGNGVTLSPTFEQYIESQFFLVQYDTTGVPQWVVTSDNDTRSWEVYVEVDTSGNPVVTGPFQNFMFIGGTELYGSGPGNIFLLKFNQTGSLMWANQSYSGGDLMIYDIDINSNNEIAITGPFVGTHEIDNQQLSIPIDDDDTYVPFYAKFDGNGNLVALSQNNLRTGSYSSTTAAVFDENGDLYITGSYKGDMEFDGTVITSNILYENIFLGKLGPLSPLNIQIDVTDSLALVDLYVATDGANWTDNSNWLTGTVDTWSGITVTGTRVEQIVLFNNNLVGSIPTSIGDLTALTDMNLGQNSLSGSIPSQIGNLTSLVDLDLHANQISGTIPAEIGNLTGLESLDLGSNNITGNIPPEIGNLTNLINLYIWGNQLTGPIPPEIGNLALLTVLDLHLNELDGEIPVQIGNLINLDSLDLINNKLSGSVPDTLASLINLHILSLALNELTDLPDLTAWNIVNLHVENNNLGFEDLEPNMGITIFTYIPQDTVGMETDTLLQAGQDITLDLTVGGTANQYQWYKDDVIMPGETAPTLALTAVTFNDPGYYTADVTNTIVTGLTLKQYPIHLKVSSLASDSLALEALYNATDGSNWTNNANWLTGTIDQWHGISIANSRVQSVELGSNNLNGVIPGDILDMIQTDTLDFSDNSITSLPDFTLLTNLDLLDVSNNYLAFEELEPNVTASGIQYNPQKDLPGNPDDTVYVNQSYQFEALTYSPNNTYKWTFNDLDISGATDSIYQITTMEKDSIGDYQSIITNSVVTGLEIRTEKARLQAIASIFGNVTYQDEPVTSGETRLFKISATGGFDTTSLAPIQVDGSYEITDVILDDYILVADADDAEYADLIPTYYGSTIFWEEADTIPLTEDITLIDIPFFEEPPETVGLGSIAGTVEEDLEDGGGRILARRKVKKATVTIKKVAGTQRKTETQEDEVVAVAYTDDNGQFLMPKLEAGTYDLNVQYPGIPMDETTDTRIIIGEDEAERDKEVWATVTVDGIVVFDVTPVVGIDEELVRRYIVYPNPSSLSITIENTEFNGDISKIVLLDVNGRVIYNNPLILYERKNLDVSTLRNGVYILKILDEHNEPLGTSRLIIYR
ncbi:T9SS type A sorting domain-containing protein [Bacteroidota bacterium]